MTAHLHALPSDCLAVQEAAEKCRARVVKLYLNHCLGHPPVRAENESVGEYRMRLMEPLIAAYERNCLTEGTRVGSANAYMGAGIIDYLEQMVIEGLSGTLAREQLRQHMQS